MKQYIRLGFIVSLIVLGCKQKSSTPQTQVTIARIDSMAAMPQPLEIIDWHKMALRFDSTVYDFNAQGAYWPLIWWDSTGKNFPQPVVALYTAIGDARQGLQHNKGMFHEALGSMGAVLGATLAGIDKSHQRGLDYVAMLKNYYNKDNGWNIMMNNTCPEVALQGGGYGRDWWYDVYPNMLFYGIYDKYPSQPGFDTLARNIAEKFCQADSVLNGNYNYSYFNYDSLLPKKNWICEQQDAAAGHAYVLYAAYIKFGDPRYLAGAKRALKTLEQQPGNTFYEIFMPFAAYMAARMNAEQGTQYNTKQFMDWTFGAAGCRAGWGVLQGRWNDIDISGIVGSTQDHGGYGFLMNTFDAAWPLVALVRYDPAYASAIGKWMLNAANATRLFYPQYMPRDHQTIPQQAEVTKGVIGYEGIVKQSTFDKYAHIKAPVAQGDGPNWVPGKNPDVSQFSVYGSAHVGIFGSIIRNTDVPGILQLNLLATDFFRQQAYPSYLYYNPYPEKKTVTLSHLPTEPIDVYDAVTRTFIIRKAGTSDTIQLSPASAAVLVFVPAGGKVTYAENKMLVNDVVVDYRFNK